jgi:proteasome assembly chaperone (PAC2) family protein
MPTRYRWVVADDRNESPIPRLDHVRWTHRPDLRRPVLITAFEGWNDAGDAASTAVRSLTEQWHAELFATVDPEIFYDFTSTRPTVRLDEHGKRQIDWPEVEIAAAHVTDDLDVITLIGVEPQLRWRTFCEQISGLARMFDARLVITVGALLADVPHTRPTPVYGAAYDDDVSAEFGLMPSRYEGPTGITGVLHAACAGAGLQSASLWAAVPTYLPGSPSPKAGLALVRRTARLLEVPADTDALETETAAYEEQINELVDADEETSDYVRHLEQAYDDEDLLASGDLIDEVERYLRDQG